MPAPDKSGGRKSYVRTVANLWGISPKTLWGVYGTESGYGANLGPSSAGAIGPFQFLPSTAADRGLKDPMDFEQSAYHAASYLASLGADRDPDSAKTAEALNRYSGGGGAAYVAKVKANGNIDEGSFNPGDITDAVSGVTDPITAPFEAARDAGEAIGEGIAWVTDPSSWLRVGKGALGFVFISIGTGALVFIIAKPIARSVIGVTGTGKAVKQAARSVAKTPKKAASAAAETTKEAAKA